MTVIMGNGGWHEGGGYAFTSMWMKRESIRHDWTGRAYTIPSGTQVISHLCAEPDAVLPDLGGYGRIYVYAEDANVNAQLQKQGREVCAVRISAASEIIACYGRPGSEHVYPAWDFATFTRVPDPAGDLAGAAAEAKLLTGYHDNYPFYSDGSWGSLDLRGFKRSDPSWGIKPSEMSKRWKQDHPEELRAVCGWTVLAERCQHLVNVVNATFAGARLERVRLLRMEAPQPGKVSKLGRHTDITDRAAGTRDGQVMRFHIPLATTTRSEMTCWYLSGLPVTRHMPVGTMWYLDARKPHSVTHGGATDRIHLVVDVLADELSRRTVSRGREAALTAP
jgi:hypothetical protein